MKYTNLENLKTGRLVAIFKGDQFPQEVITEDLFISEFIEAKTAYIYLGDPKKYSKKCLKKIATAIFNQLKRSYGIEVNSFARGEVRAKDVAIELVYAHDIKHVELFSKKTKKKEKSELEFSLIDIKREDKPEIEKAKIISDANTFAKNLQIMPPNYLTSEEYGKIIVEEFKDFSSVNVTILNKKQIQDLKMGLLLAVNLGSAYEPRVAIIEYNGDKGSSEKTALVGKGITFDAGGMNVKPGTAMVGMKYDMSGSAVVAGAMKAIAQTKPKKNVVGILVITDNMISPIAMTPDSVHESMNGKTVEINHTDAEGRLALADGLTYAIRKLKATRLIDIATLTGAMLSALGQTYSGVWSTTDKAWKDIEMAAKSENELIWRMPLHNDFRNFISKTKVADVKNTDFTRNAGSSSAAMFLKEFTEDVEYIHIDIAGTADIKEVPMSPLVRTLVKLFSL